MILVGVRRFIFGNRLTASRDKLRATDSRKSSHTNSASRSSLNCSARAIRNKFKKVEFQKFENELKSFRPL